MNDLRSRGVPIDELPGEPPRNDDRSGVGGPLGSASVRVQKPNVTSLAVIDSRRVRQLSRRPDPHPEAPS
jgi:hypothetical protein